MNDEEVERRLRRFRAAGPPGSMRGRVLAALDQQQASQTRVAGWLAAVAALLLLTVASQWSSNRLIASADIAAEDESIRFAEAIEKEMGSTEEARMVVSRIVTETLTRQLERSNPVSGQEPQVP